MNFFSYIILLFFLPTIVFAFTPISGSPLADGEHPRLLITQDSMPEIRAAIAADSTLREGYQDYIDWLSDSTLYNRVDNEINIAGHDPLSAPMLGHALVAQIGEVSGVSFPSGWTRQRYAELAFDTMESKLDSGSSLAHVGTLVYDWTYEFIPDTRRNAVAQKLASATISHEVFDGLTLYNPELTPQQVYGSKYVESFFPYYLGLALWGDGYVDAAADNAVDQFYGDMLNFGYFDAHSFQGAEGGWEEWIGYGAWHPKNHMLFVDVWRTATDEDYISGSHVRVQPEVPIGQIKNYATFMQYAIDPHRYVNEPGLTGDDAYDHFTFVKGGAAETTDTSLDHGEKVQELWYLPGLLYDAGLTTEAALVRGFDDRYMLKWILHVSESAFAFIGASGATAPTTTPEAQNFQKSYWLKNHGSFIARTGFNSEDDTVFVVSDAHYRYMDSGRGVSSFPGFSLNKFGPLTNTRYVAHRGYGNLDDYPGAFRDNLINFGVDDIDVWIEDPVDVAAVVQGDPDYDLGGIEQVTSLDGELYHVTTFRDYVYPDNIHHVREYLFLPGDNPTLDSDYLIIYDRTDSTNTPEWNQHVPWEPTSSGHTSSSDITTGSGLTDRIGTRYSGTDIIIKELNGLGGEDDNEAGTLDFVGGSQAHGVLFSKTLLPRSADVEVTRVAAFDNDVYKRQHHLAIKAHRWQVTTIPKDGTSTFLHVMQTGEESRHTSMTQTTYLDAGAMEGSFIASEKSGRPNSVVLFNKNDGAYTAQFSYTVTGTGITRHAIANLQPNTRYEITDSRGDTFFRDTIAHVERWDYRGKKEAIETGTLYFETSLSGTHTFTLRPEGASTVTCSDIDGDNYQVASDGSSACGVVDCNDNNGNIFPGATEICGNGIDEDCSGNDLTCQTTCTNGQTRSCTSGLQGICSAGTETCVNNDWSGSCVQDQQATAEICDNSLDDDCDGQVDEGCSTQTFIEFDDFEGATSVVDPFIDTTASSITTEEARSGTHSLKMCAGDSCKFSYRQTLSQSADTMYSRYWFKVGEYQDWYAGGYPDSPYTNEHYKNPGFEGGSTECKGGSYVGDDCLTIRSRLATPYYGVWLEGSMGYAQGLDETINVIDNQWHCFETMVQLNTPGQSNGVVKFWVDGQESTMANYNFRGTKTWDISKWWWTYWSNDNWLGPTYIDDFAISTQRIGCDGDLPVCEPTAEICGNGVDEDCSGNDLQCGVCADGIISSRCLCGGLLYESGYCCGETRQESECTPTQSQYDFDNDGDIDNNDFTIIKEGYGNQFTLNDLLLFGKYYLSTS